MPNQIPVDQPITPSPQPSLRFVSVDARARPDDFGAQVGQGLDSISRGLDSVSSTISEVSDKRDALFAQNAALQGEVYWKQQMAKAQQEFTLDPSKGMNYAEDFKQQFNDYQQGILAQNPNISQNAKALLMTHLNRLGAENFSDALSLQAKASTDWSVQSYQSITDNINKSANSQGAKVTLNADGSVDSTFDAARQQATQAAATAKGIVPTAMVKDNLLKQMIEFDKGEIDTSTQQNGAGVTAKLIADGHLGTSLTIPQRQVQVQELTRQEHEDTIRKQEDYLNTLKGYNLQVQATGQRDPLTEADLAKKANDAYGNFGPGYAAQAGRKVLTSEDNKVAQDQVDDYLKQIDGKYKTPEDKANFLKSLQDPNHTTTPEELNDQFLLTYGPQIRAAENPQDALNAINKFKDGMRQQVADSVEINKQRSALPNMSLDDLQSAKNTLDSVDEPSSVQKAMKPIIQQRINAIKQDPFTVTATEDKTTNNLLQQADSTSKLSAQATNMLGESSQDRANSIYQQAIARSLSLQTKINPGGVAAVMSRNDADFYTNQLANAQSGTQRLQMLDSLKAKFGDYWPQAQAQMHNNRNNPLPMGIGLVASASPQDANLINSAISIPDGKGVGKDKEKEDNPGYTKLFTDMGKPEDEKDIDSKIANDDTLNKYRAANAGASNSKETMDMVNSTFQSVGKVAKMLYLNPPSGTSYTTDQAVAAAVKVTLGKHVDFGDSNGITYLINRDGKNGTYSDDDTKLIKTQLDRELTSIAATHPSAPMISGGTKPDSDVNTALGDLNTPGQRAQNADIQDKAFWVTKSDLSGVSLYIPGTEGSSFQAIPVPNSFRSFEDMLNKGKNYKEPDSKGDILGRMGDL